MADVTVTIGGEALVASPLPVGAIKRLWPVLQGLMKPQADLSLDVLVDAQVAVVFESLKLSNPSITREVIEDSLTVQALSQAVADVFRITGFVARDPNAPSPQAK